MAAAEEHERPPQEASPKGENAALAANQVSSKSAQKPLGNGVEKGQELAPSELDTEKNSHKSMKEAGTELTLGAEDAPPKQLRDEGLVGSVEEDPATADVDKDTDGKTADPVALGDAPVALGDAPVPMEVETSGQQLQEGEEVAVHPVEHVEAGGEKVDEPQQSTKQSLDGGIDGPVKEIVDDDAATLKVNAVAVEVDESKKHEGAAVDAGETTAATTLQSDKTSSDIAAVVVNGDGDEKRTEETTVAMEVDSEEKEMRSASMGDIVEGDEKVEGSVSPQTAGTSSASSEGHHCATAAGVGEDVDMAPEDSTPTQKETQPGNEQQEASAEVTEVVGQIVNSLVENVVEFVDETMSVDAESVRLLSSPKMLSSPNIPHLSADEAMELLEVHQGDDNELLPGHDDGADADVEVEPMKNLEYQWFDGDADDDEGVAIEAPSVLDVSETTDDVFGFGGAIDLTGDTQTPGNNADIQSDGSGDTVVIHSSKSSSSGSSSSSASSRSSSSSSSSSSSASSASEDENVRHVPKKRQAPVSSGPRKLLKYKKQKRSRHAEPEPSRRRQKRKRKIPQPDIPDMFKVFETEAADPILRGSYAVRNNRRACFVGHWGFSDEAFHNIESVSPFEYTSRIRVPQSRRKDDKRPVSGKYGGFFKLRQFNGSLVKIREEQVELNFLPMPPSDEEAEDEDMEGYESDSDDGEEPAVSRYTVLGKGKNRFGRFLIRGYLNSESGRLTVKRRYLE
ncbi:hypothetical protein PF005_g9720 [Phytophthora fragariae]|uniref:Uncharacterized protein n=2 Tax=Phytophthora fragariae TaxID=53985 RepID=A0A6A3Y9X4_9STRA|nr:hypothetical protein PF003_g33101 [Phytophthora fragariae]KAE9115871.1 hypothetical protein PF007_g9868 [Phytophthora fragariae]KAE9115995.1 hypothetical protein PF010_g9127 [Phytophthora fragariae]KAE9214709.1 hypothetical protein PF005_g9720 [Phytophthora fragariae]KAE9237533.1 hypothetical protein PF002_g10924 [Phytophthora fragariae]